MKNFIGCIVKNSRLRRCVRFWRLLVSGFFSSKETARVTVMMLDLVERLSEALYFLVENGIMEDLDLESKKLLAVEGDRGIIVIAMSKGYPTYTGAMYLNELDDHFFEKFTLEERQLIYEFVDELRRLRNGRNDS